MFLFKRQAKFEVLYLLEFISNKPCLSDYSEHENSSPLLYIIVLYKIKVGADGRPTMPRL